MARLAVMKAFWIAVLVVLAGPVGAAPPWLPQASIPPGPPPPPGVPPARPVGRQEPAQTPACRQALSAGKRLLAQGRYRQADHQLSTVIKQCPAGAAVLRERARARLLLGYLGWNVELVAGALADLEAAVRLRPADPTLVRLLALARRLLVRQCRSLPPGKRCLEAARACGMSPQHGCPPPGKTLQRAAPTPLGKPLRRDGARALPRAPAGKGLTAGAVLQ